MTARLWKWALGCLGGTALFLASYGPLAFAQNLPPPAVTGQLLDAQAGFIFFTTGDAFRLAKNLEVLNYDTARPTGERLRPRLYVRAIFDIKTGEITAIALSHHRLPTEGFGGIKRFAVALSTPAPNPDLGPTPGRDGKPGTVREGLNGLPVLYTFTVQVPPTTPLTDSVYMSTDTSGWNPQAFRLDRIDALHYRLVRRLNSGTVLHYRYTRGTQLSTERGQNGLETDPHSLLILNADVGHKTDVVYHWGDESASGQTINPLAVPTPFQANPFPGLPPGPCPTFTPPH